MMSGPRPRSPRSRWQRTRKRKGEAFSAVISITFLERHFSLSPTRTKPLALKWRPRCHPAPSRLAPGSSSRGSVETALASGTECTRGHLDRCQRCGYVAVDPKTHLGISRLRTSTGVRFSESWSPQLPRTLTRKPPASILHCIDPDFGALAAASRNCQIEAVEAFSLLPVIPSCFRANCGRDLVK